LSATRFCPGHEDSSRHLGLATGRCLVPAMAGHESAPSGESHDSGDFRADAAADFDPGP
jgi:hypothetical protein